MNCEGCDHVREFSRRYRVTQFQMQEFRRRLSDDKRVTLQGSPERGQVTLSLPFGLGEVLLGYQHSSNGGVPELEVTLIRKPATLSRDSVWETIANKIAEAQADTLGG